MREQVARARAHGSGGSRGRGARRRWGHGDVDAVAKAALCDVRHRRDSRPSMLGGARVAADLVCRRSLGKFSGPLSTTPYSSMARGKRESMPRSDFFLVRLLSLRPVSPRTTSACRIGRGPRRRRPQPGPKHRPGTLSRLVAVRPPPVVRCPGYSSSPQSSKHCPDPESRTGRPLSPTMTATVRPGS